MAVDKVTVCYAEVPSQPGALHKVLAKVAESGIDLYSMMAFEARDGKGLIYGVPKPGIPLTGLQTAEAVRVTGADAQGAGAKALEPLAAAGLNLKVVGAVAEGGEMHMFIIADDPDAVVKALGG